MLDTLASVAQVLGAIAVVTAIAFGVAQIRQFRQQRRDALAVERDHADRARRGAGGRCGLSLVGARLKPWAEVMRKEQGQPLLLEWYQRPVERLEERDRPAAIPAYERLRDWTPTHTLRGV